MIHFNQQLRETGPQGRLQELVQPQTYLALTLSDFLDEKSGVEPPSLIRACLLGAQYLHGKPLINFQNIRYRRISSDLAQLEDLNTELQLGIFSPQHLDRAIYEQGILDGDRIQWATIIYQVSKDEGHLYWLQKSLNIGKPELVPRPINDLVPTLG